MLVIHTREGHRPDLSDAPKARSSAASPACGSARSAHGSHSVVEEPGTHRAEPPCHRAGRRKPGKGAFYATDLQTILQTAASRPHRLRRHTEVCVNTTVREANDRGYRCIVPGDCCGSYFPSFTRWASP